jgi:bifunctional non-homologous end joining protein LigD
MIGHFHWYNDHMKPKQSLLKDIERLRHEPSGAVLRIDPRHSLSVKHPTKVLWPNLGTTTVDLMRYYVQVSKIMLPHIKERPLSFRRFPQGIERARNSQFHQSIKWPTPAGVTTASFPAEGKTFETRLIAGDLTTLLYCVNLAIISQDVWLSRVGRPDHPDYAVFDLDPSPSVPFRQVVDIAWRLHALLDEHGVPHGVKTSGVSGLHVYVPVVNADYRVTRTFVTQFASRVVASCPHLATVTRSIQERGRRVYIDLDQNMRAKTMAAPYSARHSAFAGVSAPVTWEELKKGAAPEDFTVLSMPERVRREGDLWKTLNQRALDLGTLIKNAARTRRISS